jgi:hypothetical protein
MDQIISSFKVKRSLNDDIWENVDAENPEEIKLKADVRAKLLQIAETFVESFKLPDLEIEDVLFLGSLSGYNWSKYSDVDLHILVDMSKIQGDPTMVEEFFDAKKRIFNDNHDITIKGYEVEVYVQDVAAENASNGVFSVLYNQWQQTPEADEPEVDKQAIIAKVRAFNKDLQTVKGMADTEKKIERIEALKEKIRKYRKSGLSENGEFSTENLVFKYLRRSGYLEELAELKMEVMDKLLSLKECRLS